MFSQERGEADQRKVAVDELFSGLDKICIVWRVVLEPLDLLGRICLVLVHLDLVDDTGAMALGELLKTRWNDPSRLADEVNQFLGPYKVLQLTFRASIDGLGALTLLNLWQDLHA